MPSLSLRTPHLPKSPLWAYVPEALAASLDETRLMRIANARVIELDAHISDSTLAEAALSILDD